MFVDGELTRIDDFNTASTVPHRSARDTPVGDSADHLREDADKAQFGQHDLVSHRDAT